MREAEKQLMRMMRQKEPRLEAREVFSAKGYRSENDAVHLMHILSRQYEPLRLRRKRV